MTTTVATALTTETSTSTTTVTVQTTTSTVTQPTPAGYTPLGDIYPPPAPSKRAVPDSLADLPSCTSTVTEATASTSTTTSTSTVEAPTPTSTLTTISTSTTTSTELQQPAETTVTVMTTSEATSTFTETTTETASSTTTTVVVTTPTAYAMCNSNNNYIDRINGRVISGGQFNGRITRIQFPQSERESCCNACAAHPTCGIFQWAPAGTCVGFDVNTDTGNACDATSRPFKILLANTGGASRVWLGNGKCGQWYLP